MITELTQQRLDTHIENLHTLGFNQLYDVADKADKLHDLYESSTGAWVECKTDYSHYYDRLLLESWANIKEIELAGLPIRQELKPNTLAYKRLLQICNKLPTTKQSLLTDTNNLESTHYLSYLFSATQQHYLYDLHELQRLNQQQQFNLFICGDIENATWLSVCRIIPIESIKGYEKLKGLSLN